MGKINHTLILIFCILLFIISYNLDSAANVFLKNLRFGVLDHAFGIITNFGIAVIIMLLMPSIALCSKKKNKIKLLWLAFFSALVLSFIIKLIVLRQRPAEIFSSGMGAISYPVIDVLYYSFPSMHAMAVFALLPILIKYLPKQKKIWITFSLLVAFSRLYFRFHYLSDVVFGGFFGYFIGIFLLEKYDKK